MQRGSLAPSQSYHKFSPAADIIGSLHVVNCVSSDPASFVLKVPWVLNSRPKSQCTLLS
jgi:hypothetical protein